MKKYRGVFLFAIIATIGILIVSYFIPSPLFPNCNIFGCVYGKGFPFPYYYSQYCTMGDLGCVDNHFSVKFLISDMLIIFNAAIVIYNIYERIRKKRKRSKTLNV